MDLLWRAIAHDLDRPTSWPKRRRLHLALIEAQHLAMNVLGVAAVDGQMVWLLLHRKGALLHIDTLVVVEENIEDARFAIAQQQVKRRPPGFLEILTLVDDNRVIALRHNSQRLEHRC